ncbi:DUF3179 domain-containing (seleno)protein [Carboxylicivirga sp. RSCT41]|uniref:DUF3179 domain-containing (seleno)protein n=1 Tax=Carboxylicivirga agarovorans TaxID=3417570 RepID=UPI003D337FA6
MKISVYLLLSILLIGCGSDDLDRLRDANQSNDQEWLVDTLKMTGTTIINPFPFATNIRYELVSELTDMPDYEEVVVFKIAGRIYVYPLNKLGIEVINDSYNGIYFTVTYCPKTKTTYVIDRLINEKVHRFAASGLLYADNLVYYDLETESLWSQMYFRCVHGVYIRQSPSFINSFRTQFGTVKDYFPEGYCLIDYDMDKTLTSQSSLKSDYISGDMVFGLIKHDSPKADGVSVLNLDQLNGTQAFVESDQILLFSEEFNYTVAFYNEASLQFTVTNQFPVVLSDNEGNNWDVFGSAVDGTRKGQELEGAESFLASWWAWQGIYESFNFIDEP